MTSMLGKIIVKKAAPSINDVRLNYLSYLYFLVISYDNRG